MTTNNDNTYLQPMLYETVKFLFGKLVILRRYFVKLFLHNLLSAPAVIFSVTETGH